MSGRDTREVILDAAEALFAEQGYSATSMRQLTAAAGVNLAAVSYHFGGKEELTKAVLARRIEPINAARLRRLDDLDPRRATVREILLAFLEPPLRAVGDGDAAGGAMIACRMFGRISMEQPPFLRDFLQTQFGAIAHRFTRALQTAAPGLCAADASWRLHFSIGAMAHVLQNAPTISHMTQGLCDTTDTDALVEQLVSFLTSGFAAPGTRRARPRQKTGKRTPRRRSRT